MFYAQLEKTETVQRKKLTRTSYFDVVDQYFSIIIYTPSYKVSSTYRTAGTCDFNLYSKAHVFATQ